MAVSKTEILNKLPLASTQMGLHPIAFQYLDFLLRKEYPNPKAFLMPVDVLNQGVENMSLPTLYFKKPCHIRTIRKYRNDLIARGLITYRTRDESNWRYRCGVYTLCMPQIIEAVQTGYKKALATDCLTSIVDPSKVISARSKSLNTLRLTDVLALHLPIGSDRGCSPYEVYIYRIILSMASAVRSIRLVDVLSKLYTLITVTTKKNIRNALHRLSDLKLFEVDYSAEYKPDSYVQHLTLPTEIRNRTYSTRLITVSI